MLNLLVYSYMIVLNAVLLLSSERVTLITSAYSTWDASNLFYNVNSKTAGLSMENTLLQAF